jgi:hypothetical protein
LALGKDLFVVADDEDKITSIDPLPLRIYSTSKPGQPVSVATIPAAALVLDPATSAELDLEGAARIGDRIYWLGSHSANSQGEARPNRQRLFATTLTRRGDGVAFVPVGVPYRTLLQDLHADPRYRPFALLQQTPIAPKKAGGVSIEGLAATPTGGLLIGFRNPIVQGKRALVATLTNPGEVLQGKGAVFADPILLDLHGQGIRSIEAMNGTFWIIAGPFGEQKDSSPAPSQLYFWSGNPSDDPERVPGNPFSGFRPALNPEGLFTMNGILMVLSDDGKTVIDGTVCQEHKNPTNRRFRSVRIAPFSF